MVAATALAAWGLVTVASATGSRAHTLPVAQLVSLGRGMATGLADRHVKTALVIATTKNAAENATTPGAVPPDPANPRAYLIVIRGRFVCQACSRPPGAKPPRGRVAYDIWVPGVGVSDFGLQSRMPRRLRRLGRIVTMRLVPPRIPARELTLHPGSGIGPVRLGVSIRRLRRELAPALAPGQYVFGPIEVYVRSRRRRVVRVIVLSPQAKVDGHRLSERYARLRTELAGWSVLDCPDGTHLLFQRTADGISTRLEFTKTRFTLAFIGRAAPATCSAPVPGF
jgi:hypothetical protein